MSAYDLARRAASRRGVSFGLLLGLTLTALFLLVLPVAAAQGAAKQGRHTGRRVVTNSDLEPFRLRREAQEEEYERTRRERGMPSKQELQRRVEEQDRRLSEMARQAEEERREAELESLRAELEETRRQLNELSLRLSQQPAGYVQTYAPPSYYPYSYAPPFQVITVLPFGHRARPRHWGFGPWWPQQQPWPGRPFNTAGGTTGNAWAIRRATVPLTPSPRR